MSVDRTTEAETALVSRLRALESEHGCERTPQPTTPEAVVELIHNTALDYWPHSAHRLFRGLLAVVRQQPPADRWWSEMDTALLILNVSNEISPGVDERWAAEYGEASANRWKEDRRLSSEFWNQEVSTWRIEDVHAVLTWLKAIEGLEFVRTSGSSDYSSALRYWTELSKRRQQKA